MLSLCKQTDRRTDSGKTICPRPFNAWAQKTWQKKNTMLFQFCQHASVTGKDLTLSQTTNFRLFQTERLCRRQFDENGRKFSKWIENFVGKGKIAHYMQFLLFAQCFQKTFTADT